MRSGAMYCGVPKSSPAPVSRESLRERERLLRERSHLARPAHFLLALNPNSARSALSARTALWLYRRMAGQAADSSGFEMERKKLERALDAGQRWSIFDYEVITKIELAAVGQGHAGSPRAGVVMRFRAHEGTC